MVSIADIAEAVGLSIGTVSQVLGRQDTRYSEHTRQRVHETAQRLGDRPNAMAKALGRGHSSAVGVMFADLTGSYANDILASALPVLEAAGFHTLIGVNYWSPEREKQELETFLERRLEGILALPLDGQQANYHMVQEAGVSLVFMCDWLEGIPADVVAMDGYDAGLKITRHLLDRGHRRLAILGVDNQSEQLRARQAGIHAALAEAGITPDPALVRFSRTSDPESVMTLTREFIGLADPPTAILASVDAVALEVQEVVCKLPPERRPAVAGIGGLPMSGHGLISLSTVAEPLAEIGRRAAELLLKRIGKKRGACRQDLLRGELAARDSTTSHPWKGGV